MYYDALVAMRQSHQRTNRLRFARGFFKDRIEGVLDETAGGSSDMQKGQGKKTAKGTNNFRGGTARCVAPPPEPSGISACGS